MLKEVDFYSSGLQSVVGGMEIYNRTIESSSPIIIVSSLSEKDGLNNIKNCIESHK